MLDCLWDSSHLQAGPAGAGPRLVCRLRPNPYLVSWIADTLSTAILSKTLPVLSLPKGAESKGCPDMLPADILSRRETRRTHDALLWSRGCSPPRHQRARP
jgi:hypothetical protein